MVFRIKNIHNKIKRDYKQRLIYKSLKNEPYLIEAYYYKKQLEVSEYKSCGKLYNKLKSNKLEDALLFQIAIEYLSLNVDIKNKVDALLLQNLVFDIKNRTNSNTFKLTVPFNKIDSYVALISQKRSQEEGRYKNSFLGDLQDYLKINKIAKGKDGRGNTLFIGNDLQFDDLNKVNDYVINEALKFSKMLMLMEEYFIHKDTMCIAKTHYNIDVKAIKSLLPIAEAWTISHKFASNEDMFSINFRNAVCHFKLPLGKTVAQVLKEVEKLFIKKELSKNNSFDSLTPTQKKVCFYFIKTMHNTLCYHKNLFHRNEPNDVKRNINEKSKRASNEYFKKIING